MVDRIEEPDDLAVDFERVRNVDLAVQQIPNRLCDDGLAVAGRSVDEERVPGGYRGPELVQHLVAQDQMGERVTDASSRDRSRQCLSILVHVSLVLGHRDRCDAHVLALFEQEERPSAAFVGDAVAK